MSETVVKVLVVDDDEKARRRLIGQFRFPDVQVVGESTLGAAAYTWAEQLDVDVVVVAVEEPVARALRTIEALSVGQRTWPVVAVSSLADRDTMRKAILAGVRDYLVLPLDAAEVRRTVVRAHQTEAERRAAAEQGTKRLGTIVTVFGVKGGIGKSTVACNVAAALAQETRHQVALLDLDLHFGDAAVMLDLVPEATIVDAAGNIDPNRPQSVEPFLTTHPSRVRLLASPPVPDASAAIAPEQVAKVLEMLAATHDYVVVDTGAQVDPVTATALDMATMVLLLVVPEVTAIRRTKAALGLMEESGYSRDKLKLVLNRTDAKSEVSPADTASALNYPVYAQIPDDRAVARSITVGVPVVMSAPKTKAGRALLDLGRGLAGADAPPPKRGRFPWPFRPQPQRPAAVPTAPPADEAAVRSAWDSVLHEAERRTEAVGNRDDALGADPADPDPGPHYVDPVAAAAAAILAGREDLVVSIASATPESSGPPANDREEDRR